MLIFKNFQIGLINFSRWTSFKTLEWLWGLRPAAECSIWSLFCPTPFSSNFGHFWSIIVLLVLRIGNKGGPWLRCFAQNPRKYSSKTKDSRLFIFVRTIIIYFLKNFFWTKESLAGSLNIISELMPKNLNIWYGHYFIVRSTWRVTYYLFHEKVVY